MATHKTLGLRAKETQSQDKEKNTRKLKASSHTFVVTCSGDDMTHERMVERVIITVAQVSAEYNCSPGQK